MTFNPEKHHRRSIRLKEYDYASPSGYFVTICTYNHEPLLGSIDRETVHLNKIGEMVKREWEALHARFPIMKMDEFVVMPNHLHGIIFIHEGKMGEGNVGEGNVGEGNVGEGNVGEGKLRPYESEEITRLHGTTFGSLGRIIQGFKSITANQYLVAVKREEDGVVTPKLWQRNYYEHVIRNEKDLNMIREYIRNNPLHWALDKNNPDNL